MRAWSLFALSLAALLFATPVLRAQEAPVRVATCNFVKVLENMDELRALEDRMRTERQRILSDKQRREARINGLKQERDALRPDSQQYREKTQELLQASIEYRVWAETTQQELARTEKEQLKALFNKIRDGAKDVADARKIDLVLAERRPDLAQDENFTPDQVKQLIAQTDVLYSNEKVDITDAVTAAVNKKYLDANRGAAPAPAPAK